MGIVDKTLDTVGGAVKGAVKGMGYALLAVAAVGAVAGFAITGGVGGVVAGALIGGGAGVAAGALTGGAAIGGLVGAGSRLGKSNEEVVENTLDKQLSVARERNNLLAAQLAERQQMASSFNNPDAKQGFTGRSQPQMEQAATMADRVASQRAGAESAYAKTV